MSAHYSEAIPEQVNALRSAASAIALHADQLSQDVHAVEELSELIRKAATQLGDGVSGPAKETFVANRASFEDSDAIVLRATLDLDRDGRRELWLLFVPTSGEGSGHAVISLGREGPEVIGSYFCRPQSDDENDGADVD